MSFRVPPMGIKAALTLWFALLDDAGNQQGYRKLKKPAQFTLTPTSESTSIKSREDETFGQQFHTFSEAGDFDLGITLEEVDAFELGIAMLGKTADINVTAGTNVAAVLAAYKGQSDFLPKRHVTANSLQFLGLDLTVTDSSGFEVGELINNTTTPGEIGYVAAKPDATSLSVYLSETGSAPTAGNAIVGATSTTTDTASAVDPKNDIAVEDTDYSVRAKTGRVDFLDGGNIPEARIQCQFDHGVYQGDKINLFTATTIKGALRGEGRDVVSNTDFQISLDRVSLAPSGALDFMDADRLKVQLSGKIETLAGKTQPGTLEFFA